MTNTDLEEHHADDWSDWRADTIAQQWEPEHQLIGALLWLPASRARAILELVPDTAIWRPRARWAYQLIRTLVDAGHDPNPVVVLAAARTQTSADAQPTRERVKELSLYLFDAYQQVIAPSTAVGDYAREVLDAAYRRAFRENGIRMQELAECDVERELLTKLFSETRDELADLWRRAEAAAQTRWDIA
ncbi:hypothetical protein JNN96_37695 [Mycobacterium sp. DSM 3803]|nr:hypothetical protein [Mycobacterium sp. DSM 3803]